MNSNFCKRGELQSNALLVESSKVAESMEEQQEDTFTLFPIAIFFKLFILKSKSNSIFGTQVPKVDFDFDFKLKS